MPLITKIILGGLGIFALLLLIVTGVIVVFANRFREEDEQEIRQYTKYKIAHGVDSFYARLSPGEKVKYLRELGMID